MIDFPASPTTGQTFDPGTGIVYSYDGVAWNAMTTSTATARAKNLLINPAMMISQENGSTAVTTNGAYPADQWSLAFSGVVGSAAQYAPVTPERSNTAAWTTVTTAKASLAAGDFDALLQPIEGLQIAELQWGTARAIPAVLRFSASATAPGTYSFSITSGGGDESYIGTFAATGTFQTFVFPIPAVTVGTWPSITNRGATLRFIHCCGTTFIGALGWQSGNFIAAPGQINAAAVANQTLNIADVGLYADPSATGLAPPFVIPEIAVELVKCQRYYRTLSNVICASYQLAASNGYAGYSLSPTMRIVPTFAATGQTYGNASAFRLNAASIDSIQYAITVTATGYGYGTANTNFNARM